MKIICHEIISHEECGIDKIIRSMADFISPIDRAAVQRNERSNFQSCTRAHTFQREQHEIEGRTRTKSQRTIFSFSCFFSFVVINNFDHLVVIVCWTHRVLIKSERRRTNELTKWRSMLFALAWATEIGRRERIISEEERTSDWKWKRKQQKKSTAIISAFPQSD